MSLMQIFKTQGKFKTINSLEDRPERMREKKRVFEHTTFTYIS